MHTAVIATPVRPVDIGARHILEDFTALLEGKRLRGHGREEQVVHEMLVIFSTARRGLDFLKSPESKKVLIYVHPLDQEVRYAIHFLELFRGNDAAERLVRAFEAALEGWQRARAAYEPAIMVFRTKELRREAINIAHHMMEVAWLRPALPD